MRTPQPAAFLAAAPAAAIAAAPDPADDRPINADPSLAIPGEMPAHTELDGPGGPDALAMLDSATNAELTPPDTAENLELLSPAEQPINVYAGAEFVSQYVSRGLVFADEFSVQPWIELDVSLTPDAMPDSPLGAVSVFAGNWNNITGSGESGLARTGNVASLDHWYEADLYAGLRLTWFDNLLTSVRFNWYTSPSDAFDQIQEIDARLSYDDTDFWADLGLEGFSTTPKIRVAKEIRDSGGEEQWYISPQLSPSFTFEFDGAEPRVTLPLALGFGAEGQYVDLETGEEHTFGFFQTGAHLALPLDWLPEERGGLTIHAGVDVIVLAEEDLSVSEEKVDAVWRFGLSYAY